MTDQNNKMSYSSFWMNLRDFSATGIIVLMILFVISAVVTYIQRGRC